MRGLLRERVSTEPCPHIEEIKATVNGKIICIKFNRRIKIRKCICCNKDCNRNN